MADSDMAIIAVARAWGVYLLINKTIGENDERRATLERFIQSNVTAAHLTPRAHITQRMNAAP
jgi:hypothetical protein